MTNNLLPVRTKIGGFFASIGRFFNPIADALAKWSWWRVAALSLLLIITGSGMDDFFFPRENLPKKKVSKQVKTPSSEVQITINNGKVVVTKTPDAAKKAADQTDTEVSKSVEQLTAELEKNERSLETAVEKLEALARSADKKSDTANGAAFEETIKQLSEVIKQIQASKQTTINVIDGDDQDDDPRPPKTEFWGPLAFLLSAAMAALNLVGGSRLRVQAATTRADQAAASADASDLQRQVAEAKLLRMQAQVEPHFLFNTLAALERLIEVNPTKALAMSQALSQWLRALLPQMKEGQSTLGQEVNLVQSYLQLMQMRMGDRLAYFVDVPEALRSLGIPSMLLQPLVENSIKHGLEPKKLGGEVRIKARHQNGLLELTVEDTGIGFSANPNTGNGLTNLRERLDLLFAGKAMVSIVPRNSFATGSADDQALTGSIITIKLPVKIG